MRIAIVYCHPWEGSLNHAILEQVMANLDEHGVEYDLMDLHADGFLPFYDAEELRLFSSGGTHDPLVTRYLGFLRAADGLIVITPLWWNSIPGMLKGFIDKVMKEGEGLSHTVSARGVHGELGNLRRAYVLTTSTSPTSYIRFLNGNAIKRIFMGQTLRQLGVRRSTWIHHGLVRGRAGDDAWARRMRARHARHLERVRTMDFRF
ncbi:NAD(P)H-dependent oxidoreductase [Propionibacterium australiense]|uniref:Flavodoxin family protein n=1 Tax=Propionibacterium australiense TaxID=119981 RepID=A0A383S4H4_9ACTN|nr:NAD(P)H-dependent oxidoreductase [Propionibacterium australiense]RLP10685.1 flavodoxin family protein [Propionibacterium australiense]RLP12980.1 flavodoxin family protein [Propionibacterium australiense]SYZ32895.1 Flavodoxin-like fold [Propionibacterium australiense]VEH91049.1 Putative NADPH-quinone reductase (modulator of drug activity B) [Propionibacterium australiense]